MKFLVASSCHNSTWPMTTSGSWSKTPSSTRMTQPRFDSQEWHGSPSPARSKSQLDLLRVVEVDPIEANRNFGRLVLFRPTCWNFGVLFRTCWKMVGVFDWRWYPFFGPQGSQPCVSSSGLRAALTGRRVPIAAILRVALQHKPGRGMFLVPYLPDMARHLQLE